MWVHGNAIYDRVEGLQMRTGMVKEIVAGIPSAMEIGVGSEQTQ
jgi:hypothetical protein